MTAAAQNAITMIKPMVSSNLKPRRTSARNYLSSFKGRPCEANCGREASTCVPAHLNMDCRGKDDALTASLCHECHAVADGRTSAPLDERRKVWMRVLTTLMRARYENWRAENA